MVSLIWVLMEGFLAPAEAVFMGFDEDRNVATSEEWPVMDGKYRCAFSYRGHVLLFPPAGFETTVKWDSRFVKG